MLQLVDLAIGAVRDHIEYKIENRGNEFGSEIVDMFHDHFRNLDGVVPTYGVTASTGNEVLTQHIKKILERKTNNRKDDTGN